ncbi:MAG: glycosyltransferase family 2 protein [Terriglobales bacterium]
MADQNVVNNSEPPLVSAVIPTRNRPELVVHAVLSALNQTFRNLEVVVVIDGPDAATEAALKEIEDARLRVIALPQNVGGSDARNTGVQAARGQWIAFLDDDDEWLPNKIERQLARASASNFHFPVISCQQFVHTGHAEMIWPREMPSEPISEYLFSRKLLSYGDGVLSMITLLTPRQLMIEVPFRSGLRKHQDTDWVLRAVRHPGVGIEFVPEPLAVWNVLEGVQTVGRRVDWKFSLEWVRSNRQLLTPRAYAGFVLTHCAGEAAAQREWRAFPILLIESCRFGSPRLFDFVLYAVAWLAQIKWLQRIANIVRGRQPVVLAQGGTPPKPPMEPDRPAH